MLGLLPALGAAVALSVAAGAAGAQPGDPGTGPEAVARTFFQDDARGWDAGDVPLRLTAVDDAGVGPHVLRALPGRDHEGGIVAAWDTGARTEADVPYRAALRVRAANALSVGRTVRLVLIEDAPLEGPARVSSQPVTLGSAYRVAVIERAVARGGALRVEVRVDTAFLAQGFDIDAVTVSRAADPAPPDDPDDPPPELTPYDPSALFNRPAPAGAPLHPRSDDIVRGLSEAVATRPVDASITGEVPPVYVADRSDPFYEVEIEGRTERIRVPAGAMPGSGDDHPLVVLNPTHPDHDRHVELRVWQASIDHDDRRISGSGAGLFHYNNDGARLNPDGSRSVSTALRGFGTGSGLSYTAGLLRPQDIAAGRIPHAIRVAWGCNGFTDGFVPPAVRTDQSAGRCGGGVPEEARVDMGMRLRLDPAVRCEERRAPVLPGRGDSARETAFLRILCRALQEYGLIIMDGTVADGLVIYMENEATADWRSVAGSTHYGGYGYIVRDATTPPDGLDRTGEHGIPWDRMQVVAE
jgi:hypothetical protein